MTTILSYLNSKIILLLTVILSFCYTLYSDNCKDYLLLNGAEDLVEFGMDTTYHWWAVTAPFPERYRMVIDGEESDIYEQFTHPVFSPDGKKWAHFATFGGDWKLITNDSIFDIDATGAGEIVFSPDSQVMAYSYFENSNEVIYCGNMKFEMSDRIGKLYVGRMGYRLAYVRILGGQQKLFVNGNEVDSYDEIKPFGFWMNGQILYAAKNGYDWSVYRGEEEISETFNSISEVKLNLKGDVAGFLAGKSSGKSTGIIISDRYIDLIYGQDYDQVYNLDIHPTEPMITYNAEKHQEMLIVLNGADYNAGLSVGKPKFTFNGEDVIYIGCGSFDCFVGISGKKVPIPMQLSESATYAYKPGSETLAYSTSSSMIVRDLFSGNQYAGKMMDYLSSPRYNRFSDRYEALGRIANRLYLMTCSF